MVAAFLANVYFFKELEWRYSFIFLIFYEAEFFVVRRMQGSTTSFMTDECWRMRM